MHASCNAVAAAAILLALALTDGSGLLRAVSTHIGSAHGFCRAAVSHSAYLC